MNESNRKIVAELEKQVKEFEKTALDRSFVEAQKALQKNNRLRVENNAASSKRKSKC